MNGFFLQNLSLSPILDNPAYLDPGSGSFILQLILATILGGLLVLRSYWNKVKDFFLKLFNRNPGEDDSDEK
jgi:hypothetical protein